jgi:asparagine synthase (glutamine-hydrolysing)
MCGIAGVVGMRDRVCAADAVRRMTGALARRGPDGEGVEAWEGAVLGHRRLAVFDTSAAGHQPMLEPGRGAGVVFNGAVYNFRALRVELERLGFAFRSRTDTEVLLHGHRAWGFAGLVERLRGMFAIALWDDAAGTLHLARDRLGVKPLALVRGDGWLAFATTPRALRAGGLAGAVDETAAAEFLDFGYVGEDRTIYRGVERLPAATVAEWRGGTLRTRTYWRPPVPPERGGPTFAEAVEETERLFLAAVERRLHADVPVGALLSGGIDSGLVCWAIARLGGDVTAYTVGTPGDPWDETADARATAGELGLRHRVVELAAARVAGVDELVAAYGEPFACASALGMLGVSRAVASGATVLLTGDGGDDAFLGYPRHRHLRAAQAVARALPDAAARAWPAVRGAVPRAGPLRRGVHFADYATGGLAAFLGVHARFPAAWRGERLPPPPAVDSPRGPASARQILAQYLEHDRRNQFVSEYLAKVDGATMHHALEARSPFLDQELWEYAAALPHEVRLRGGRLKAVLREISRRRIGARVARGSKRGFGVPVQRWIAGPWRPRVEAALRDGILAKEGWIRPAPVLAALARTPSGGSAPEPIWYLYVLEAWTRAERQGTYDGAEASVEVAVLSV